MEKSEVFVQRIEISHKNDDLRQDFYDLDGYQLLKIIRAAESIFVAKLNRAVKVAQKYSVEKLKDDRCLDDLYDVYMEISCELSDINYLYIFERDKLLALYPQIEHTFQILELCDAVWGTDAFLKN